MPSRQELQKLEDSEKHIICSNTINRQSSLYRPRQQIHDGNHGALSRDVDGFKFLCLATGGPQPSVQSVIYNLKHNNYKAVFPAYLIIKASVNVC